MDTQCSRDIQRCGARSYLELLITKETEKLLLVVETERVARLASERAIDTARQLQATEYSRRLEDLNHENSRISAAQAIYVTKDTFEGLRKEYIIGHTNVLDRIERVADLLPTYVTREVYEGNNKLDLTWKLAIDKRMAESKGANDRTILLFGVAVTIFNILLHFLPV